MQLFDERPERLCSPAHEVDLDFRDVPQKLSHTKCTRMAEQLVDHSQFVRPLIHVPNEGNNERLPWDQRRDLWEQLQHGQEIGFMQGASREEVWDVDV